MPRRTYGKSLEINQKLFLKDSKNLRRKEEKEQRWQIKYKRGEIIVGRWKNEQMEKVLHGTIGSRGRYRLGRKEK